TAHREAGGLTPSDCLVVGWLICVTLLRPWHMIEMRATARTTRSLRRFAVVRRQRMRKMAGMFTIQFYFHRLLGAPNKNFPRPANRVTVITSTALSSNSAPGRMNYE